MKSLLIILAPVWVASLGCGGPGGEALTARSIGTVMGQLGTSLGKLPTSNSLPSLPVSGVTTSAVSPLAISCETVSPSTLVDADGDSIAAQKTSTFDCTSFSSGSDSLTRKGTITIKDKDDSVAGIKGGLRVDFNITKFNSRDSSGNDNDYSYVGYWDYVGSASGAFTSTADFTGSTKYESNGYKNDYSYNYVWNWSLSPDNSGSPWTSGSVTVTGSFTLSGKFKLENQTTNVTTQESGSFAVQYYSVNLKYDNSCSKFYKSGSFVVLDGNGNVLRVVYSCSTAKFYVNSVESTLYTP